MNEMEKFEGELAIKRAGLQALRLNVADPSTLMQLKGTGVIIYFKPTQLKLNAINIAFTHQCVVFN